MSGYSSMIGLYQDYKWMQQYQGLVTGDWAPVACCGMAVSGHLHTVYRSSPTAFMRTKAAGPALCLSDLLQFCIFCIPRTYADYSHVYQELRIQKSIEPLFTPVAAQPSE